jgi:signal transduction histidine kinase
MTSPEHHILIVDDSAEDRLSFGRFLGRCHSPTYKVIEADSGEAGLIACRKQMPDCILLDYNLPDVNGIEFLAQLKEVFPDGIPAVVILTGQGSETIAVETMKAGAQDYLVKGKAEKRVCKTVHDAISTVMLEHKVSMQAREMQVLFAERAKLFEELKQHAIALKDADRRKDQFLATLAHELRNPLAPIRSAMHILKRMYPGAHHVTEVRAVVERQLGHMTRLIDDLMDVGRITNNKVALQKETIELSTAIAHAVEICRPMLEVAQHKVDVSFPANNVMLNVDPVRLVQILANILSNACKYTHQPGSISFNATVENENVIFTIRDPGIGMEAHALNKIFDTFTQIDPSPGRIQSGLGIGLSLAKQFAELHSGTICSSSRGLGHGSEFVITLPVVCQSINEDTTINSLNKQKTDPGNRQVLLVDDNRDGTDMLQRLFEADGFSVTTAYNGLDAVEAVQKRKPDIIVMDLGMPGIDGFEAIKRIRQQPGTEGILAIAVTGWDQDVQKARTKVAGFNHHFVKPVDFDELRNFLDRTKP